ncbi:MAG: fasciclin domain-containing protein [Candidatus Nanopelagicales bacterium]|jgi:uncharacterized surface protein with fasciclin (FAS1) repeats|nr:fasciclin domain-containing protein [Candidatus Nanopelagicales bacterium]
MIRRTIAGLTAAAALAAPLALAAPASATVAKPTLFQAVAASLANNNGKATDRNWYDFDILANGVLAAGLKDRLNDPKGAKLTVFIPNDRAFQALIADLVGPKYWFASEATILAEVVKLEKAQPGTLATVITYHAVPGEIDSTTALSVPKGTALTTLQGGDIKVYPLPRLGTAILADQDPNDANPFLVRSKLDIQASNGIAHGISLVLRPINL